MFRLGPRAGPGVRKSGHVSKTDSIFVETVRRLREATALGGVAQMRAETAEPPVRTARKLKGIAPDEWLIFEKGDAKGEVFKHYLTERGITLSRKELDERSLER